MPPVGRSLAAQHRSASSKIRDMAMIEGAFALHPSKDKQPQLNGAPNSQVAYQMRSGTSPGVQPKPIVPV